MAADIIQLQNVASAMKSSYSGVTGSKNVTPGSNIMSASEVSIDQQTGVLEDIKELQQQQLRQSFLTNSFLAKSFQMEMDKMRREREQATELRKELAKLTGAGAVGGSLGLAGSGTGGGGGDEEDGQGGGSGLVDLAQTVVTATAATQVAKTVAGGKNKGTSTDKGTDKGKGKGKGKNKFLSKDFLKKIAGNKYAKGGGLLTALLSVANIGLELSDIGAAKATGDEDLIYEETKDVAEAAGSGLGALGGASAGAMGGAALGTLLFPGIGTAIGGFLGFVGGGIAGAFGGEKVGGGLFDLFADDPKEKEAKKEYEESIKRRIPIKKRDLKGRGFNHRRVNTYWFDKGKDGKWYIYTNKKAKKPIGFVKDSEVIDFLEGRISKIPNAYDEMKKHNEDLKSNEAENDVLEESTKTYDLTQGKNPKDMTKDGLFLSGSGSAMATNLYANDTDYKSAAEQSFMNDVQFKSEVDKITRRNLDANTKEEATKLLKEGEELVEQYDGSFEAITRSKEKIGVFDKELYVAAYDIARNRIESYLDNAEKVGHYNSKTKKWKYDFAQRNFSEFLGNLQYAMSTKLLESGLSGDESLGQRGVIEEATKKAFYDVVPQGKGDDMMTANDMANDDMMSPDDYYNQMIDDENKGGPGLLDKVKSFFGFGKKKDMNTELQKYAQTGVKMSDKEIDRYIAQTIQEVTGKEADEEQIKKMKANMKLNPDGSITFGGGFAMDRYLTDAEFSKYKELGGGTQEGLFDPNVRNYLKQVSPMSSDKIASDVKKSNVDIDNLTPTGNITVNNQPITNNTSSQTQSTTNTASLDTTQDPYKDKIQNLI